MIPLLVMTTDCANDVWLINDTSIKAGKVSGSKGVELGVIHG